MPRITIAQAYQQGVKAGRTKILRPAIPYTAKALKLAFIQGFESIRPWPY